MAAMAAIAADTQRAEADAAKESVHDHTLCSMYYCARSSTLYTCVLRMQQAAPVAAPHCYLTYVSSPHQNFFRLRTKTLFNLSPALTVPPLHCLSRYLGLHRLLKV